MLAINSYTKNDIEEKMNINCQALQYVLSEVQNTASEEVLNAIYTALNNSAECLDLINQVHWVEEK